MTQAPSRFPDSFEQSRQRHAALAQLFRWFQVYERPQTDATLQNQLDILMDDVMIETFTHTANGKASYRERLSFYQNSQNAHHIEHVALQSVDHNTVKVEADIVYQGIAADHQRRSYRVHYQTLLALATDRLPLFSTIKLTVGNPVPAAPFKDAYCYNRAVSLMHYWLYCVETAKGEVARFKELLAKDFELHFSVSGVVNSWEQFENWIKASASQVNASAHDEKNLSVTENPDGTIQLRMEFDWRGLSGDNQPMTARTQHEWTVVNDTSERFARIKKMVVTQLEPFRVISEEAVLPA